MKIHLSEAGTPDLFVRAADSTWCPAYAMRDRVLDGVYRTTYYVHHPEGVAAVSPDRLDALAAEGRALTAAAVFAVVDLGDAPADGPTPALAGAAASGTASGAPTANRPAGDRPPRTSVRAARLDEDGPSRWERLRRLLNARCQQLAAHAGEDPDDARHAAARAASDRRTGSSMELTDDEMEQAVSFVEHVLWERGFDLDAADEEYARRRALQDSERSHQLAA